MLIVACGTFNAHGRTSLVRNDWLTRQSVSVSRTPQTFQPCPSCVAGPVSAATGGCYLKMRAACHCFSFPRKLKLRGTFGIGSGGEQNNWHILSMQRVMLVAAGFPWPPTTRPPWKAWFNGQHEERLERKEPKQAGTDQLMTITLLWFEYLDSVISLS